MNKIKGFTLIELLVVIAIIALLLAVLMPSLRVAKEQSRAIFCLSDVRQLALAWHAYTTDNDGRLVGGMAGVQGEHEAYHPDMWYAWVAIPQDDQGNYTGYPPGTTWVDAPLEDKLRGIKDGLLFPYVESVDVYHCPSDWRSRKVFGTAQYPGWRSYTIGCGMNVDSPYVKRATKITEIKSPGSKYVFVENLDPRGWNMGNWDIWVPSRSEVEWWNVVASWHRDKCNWGFADGHAETERWRDKRTALICNELDYPTQVSIRAECSVDTPDLGWIVDHRMNDW